MLDNFVHSQVLLEWLCNVLGVHNMTWIIKLLYDTDTNIAVIKT